VRFARGDGLRVFRVLWRSSGCPCPRPGTRHAVAVAVVGAGLGGLALPAHGLPLELDAMHVLQQAVQDPQATVGSPRASCHMATGSWLVTMVERSPTRSSITSSTSAAWSEANGLKRKSSISNTSTRAHDAIKRLSRPSARASAISSWSRGPRR
jgi:hypothetical protein